MKIVNKTSSTDGSIKYGLKTEKGGLIEAIYYKFGMAGIENRPILNDYKEKGAFPEYGICISTQVGCAMGCTFCATGYGGYFANLSAKEMQEQLNVIYADIIQTGIETAEKKANIVMMGMGEPLMNYSNVLSFCKNYHQNRMSQFIRLLSLSTIGISPNIRKLAKERIPIKLYLSIHSPFEEERKSLIPISNQYPLSNVLETCIHYAKTRGEKVIACYLLLKEVNDTTCHAKALAKLLPANYFDLQLLNYNSISFAPYERSERTAAFQKVLENNSDLCVDIRISKGQEIQGGCGQLVQKYKGKSLTSPSLKDKLRKRKHSS